MIKKSIINGLFESKYNEINIHKAQDKQSPFTPSIKLKLLVNANIEIGVIKSKIIELDKKSILMFVIGPKYNKYKIDEKSIEKNLNLAEILWKISSITLTIKTGKKNKYK